MKTGSRFGRIASRALVIMLSFTMLLTMMPTVWSPAYAGSGLEIKSPALTVTGKTLIGNNGVYSNSSVSLEKSYTLDELKNFGSGHVVNAQKYSAMKSQEPFARNYYKANGVKLSSLLGKEESNLAEDVTVLATDGYAVQFLKNGKYSNGKIKTVSLSNPRYFYDLSTGERGEQVPAIIAWAEVSTNCNDGSVPEALPEGDPKELGYLKLFCGQLDIEGGRAEDMNNSLFSGKSTSIQVCRVIEGDAIDETVLSVNGQEYTRADILAMDLAETSYTYLTSNGEATDFVRGVPMSVLLGDYSSNDIVTFTAADGYDVAASGYTVGQLIENDYMLAYEKGSGVDDLEGIYETAKNDKAIKGFFRLYGKDENGKPAKLVNNISVTTEGGIDFSNSPYKHITNGGSGGSAPYNLDAITGATLTVEGPGVKSSVPVSVRDLEGRNAGAVRADYADNRGGSNVTRTYEGIDLYYILHNMSSGENGIKLTDLARKVLIKNRNRKTIAEFTLSQINEAHKTKTPVIVAYGTSMTDGSNIRPFVFDNGSGADRTLGNEDGCIKLVYNKSAITGDVNSDYTTFGNMAYIYVSEEKAPGYKHDKDPYKSPEISNYVLTVTGEKIGREVNYTVDQLEKMVIYDTDGNPDNNSMGYRDEYSLANSTYWYVNEYEGVQLWKLLLKSGLDPKYASDDKTIVSSTATDGYAATDKFTAKQVADPDSFGFYEKNPADNNDGKYKGNENIRQGKDVSTGDKLRTGYPVLVAYGVNGYPYVEKSSQEGYLSGLQNDGGPLRVISGKMNYGHANGSNQAKYLDKILVGDDTYHYSTHKYHSDDTYKSLEDSKISVKVLNGDDEDVVVLKDMNITAGDIEEMIYGGKLTRNQLAEAKVKTFYQITKNGNTDSDLYEGINLNYLLKEIVELPGNKGTITFSDGTDELTLNLGDVLATDNGSNTETGMSGLPPVLAYGKNGAPLVTDKTSAGYQEDVTLAEGTEYKNAVAVRNDGGPLEVIFPQTDNSVSGKSLAGVKSITIRLSPDKYAHIKTPYKSYSDRTIMIKGEGTRLGEGKEFSIAELEGKQTIAFTGDYKVPSGSENLQIRYRGLELYKLLTSSSIGLKSNADKVIIETADKKTTEFTLSEIRKTYVNPVTGETGLPVILAYGAGIAGSADTEDGLPLVEAESSEGYVSEYKNAGGPMCLVIGQTDTNDSDGGFRLDQVVSIEVTASEMTSWNHNTSEVYKQYRDETVELIVNDQDGKNLFSKTYTVGEIEDNEDLVERITANIVDVKTWEGIHFWRWVKKETKGIGGMDDPVSVTVFAADNYNVDAKAKFGKDGLENGILDGGEFVPIILAYGVGGYPLVIGDKSHSDGEGYDATAGNNGGPLRLITHNSQGSSLTYVTKVVIVAGKGSSEPEDKGFKEYSTAGGVRSTWMDQKDTIWVGTYGGGLYNKEAGSSEFNVLNTSSSPALLTDFTSAVAVDADGGVWVSQNASYTQPGNNQGVLYIKDNKVKQYTADGKTIPNNYVQAIKVDKDGKVWMGSFGGLTIYDPSTKKWKTYSKADKGFPATSINTITLDGNGGAWLGFYPDGAGTEEDKYTGGMCHIDKKGKVSHKTVLVGEMTADKSTSKLAQAWIRSIAIDREGNVWAVAAGTNLEENEGGTILKYEAGSTTPKLYTGKSLFGKYLDGSATTEVRVVAVDSKGALWFGTSADGVLVVNDPKTGSDGSMTVSAQYSYEDGSWSAPNMNNVYSIDFWNGGTAYIGSAGGLAVLGNEPEAVTDGAAFKVNSKSYRVLSRSSKTAAFTKANNSKSVSVPATVKYKGVTYKVKQIDAKAFTGKKIRTVTIGKNVNKIRSSAFKGSKATKMIVKTKSLKKSSVKGSLKGSKIKKVKVKVGKRTLNKKYARKYKKYFTKKNAGRKATVGY